MDCVILMVVSKSNGCSTTVMSRCLMSATCHLKSPAEPFFWQQANKRTEASISRLAAVLEEATGGGGGRTVSSSTAQLAGRLRELETALAEQAQALASQSDRAVVAQQEAQAWRERWDALQTGLTDQQHQHDVELASLEAKRSEVEGMKASNRQLADEHEQMRARLEEEMQARQTAVGEAERWKVMAAKAPSIMQRQKLERLTVQVESKDKLIKVSHLRPISASLTDLIWPNLKEIQQFDCILANWSCQVRRFI
ncbi:unnamed protein product [Protopolystoma xenopodis]|uniref:Uncharacterized protein n=1 Tax=Protopolystoma xenopodis TaxID=117903 RepID=A0A3S5AMS6_9PLAT|nr:unnamed protein product [Protopolystoma xenopodis]